MPKAVLSGTTTSAISSVSFSACTAFGFDTASQNGPSPCSNARQKISATGATRMTPTYASDVKRTAYLPIMAHRPVPHGADHEEDAERDQEQEHRKSRGARRVAPVQVLEHVERRDLGLEREVARDQDHGTELA